MDHSFRLRSQVPLVRVWRDTSSQPLSGGVGGGEGGGGEGGGGDGGGEGGGGEGGGDGGGGEGGGDGDTSTRHTS